MQYPLTYRPLAVDDTLVPLQIAAMPNTTHSCMRIATTSIVHEWVYFRLPSPNQPADLFTIPGLFPQQRFTRIQP